MIRQILVPLDGSRLSELAIERALEVASTTGASLLLLRTPVSTHSTFWAEIDSPAILDEIKARDIDDCGTYLNEHADRIRQVGVACSTLVLSGDPHKIIPSAARETSSDLIVMASHNRTGRARWLLGSVADHVLHHTNLPVIVVREEPAPQASECDQRPTREEILRRRAEDRTLVFWPRQ
jgi:nucleotide-binding universal stress UspA family protein